MLATLTLAAAIVAAPHADKWDLKPDLAADKKETWSVTVNVDAGAEKHEAKFNMVRTMKKSPDGKPKQAKVTWDDLVVDGAQNMPTMDWEAVIEARGTIFSIEDSEGSVLRAMLAPFTFAYPEAGIEAGDKWSFVSDPDKAKPDLKITYAYTAGAVEKIKGEEAMKITGTVKEMSKGGMTADGTWWVAKSGKVLKFDVNVKDWVVPMANGDPMAAHIVGESK